LRATILNPAPKSSFHLSLQEAILLNSQVLFTSLQNLSDTAACRQNNINYLASRETCISLP